jgi:general secretion pathway protein G
MNFQGEPMFTPSIQRLRRHQPRSAAAAGFTLIELLLVLVILAVLAAVVVPKFTNRSEQAKVSAAKADISNIETALDTFEVDTGRFPGSDEGLKALVDQPSNVKEWHGPYIKRGVPNDPWGNPYVYRYPGVQNKNGYDLFSYGPDGHEGGTDDIVNWTQQ